MIDFIYIYLKNVKWLEGRFAQKETYRWWRKLKQVCWVPLVVQL